MHYSTKYLFIIFSALLNSEDKESNALQAFKSHKSKKKIQCKMFMGVHILTSK